jgi:hypothetical protein
VDVVVDADGFGGAAKLEKVAGHTSPFGDLVLLTIAPNSHPGKYLTIFSYFHNRILAKNIRIQTEDTLNASINGGHRQWRILNHSNRGHGKYPKASRKRAAP